MCWSLKPSRLLSELPNWCYAHVNVLWGMCLSFFLLLVGVLSGRYDIRVKTDLGLAQPERTTMEQMALRINFCRRQVVTT